MKRLTEKKKECLKYFKDYICEDCHKKKDKSELQIHRINRGYMGGSYEDFRNLKVICTDCHKRFHHREFK